MDEIEIQVWYPIERRGEGKTTIYIGQYNQKKRANREARQLLEDTGAREVRWEFTDIGQGHYVRGDRK